MRREYTAAEKAAWNKRYYEKRRRAGWITCSFQVPVSVSRQVKKLKRELTQEYKKSHAKEEAKLKALTGVVHPQ